MNSKKKLSLRYLFLGYGSKKTKIIKFVKKKGIKVKHLNRKIYLKDIKNIDLVISFGYQKIIKKKILKKLSRPPINLHMSYLPFNRGSHPNFWSFIKNSPKGVTIHEINQGIDTGKIIFRKKFILNPRIKKFSTFKKTYNFLFKELESLFITKFNKISDNKYRVFKQHKKYTFHYLSELPKNLTNWNTCIIKFKKILDVRNLQNK